MKYLFSKKVEKIREDVLGYDCAGGTCITACEVTCADGCSGSCGDGCYGSCSNRCTWTCGDICEQNCFSTMAWG